MKVTPIASDSLGVRSLACYMERSYGRKRRSKMQEV